jgi:hypothetical protein
MAETIAALVAASLLGCGNEPPKPPPLPAPPEWTEALRAEADALEAALAAEPPAPAGELVVRLAFGDGADLDLYVSDPLDETVYYANTPARSGGALDADRRCEHAGRRVETVRFAAPPHGRYRAGVDFPEVCGEGARVAAFALSVDSGGERRLLRGLAEWNVFASRVDEFAY